MLGWVVAGRQQLVTRSSLILATAFHVHPAQGPSTGSIMLNELDVGTGIRLVMTAFVFVHPATFRILSWPYREVVVD